MSKTLWIFVGTFLLVGWLLLTYGPLLVTDPHDRLESFALIVAGIVVLLRVLSGENSDDLTLAVSARQLPSKLTKPKWVRVRVTLTLSKTATGSIRVLDIRAWWRDDLLAVRDTDAKLPTACFGNAVRELLLHEKSPAEVVRGERMVMSKGDTTTVVADLKLRPARSNEPILDVAVLGRRHPVNIWTHLPQWRASCSVSPAAPASSALPGAPTS